MCLRYNFALGACEISEPFHSSHNPSTWTARVSGPFPFVISQWILANMSGWLGAKRRNSVGELYPITAACTRIPLCVSREGLCEIALAGDSRGQAVDGSDPLTLLAR
jgi:hypothetical protein